MDHGHKLCTFYSWYELTLDSATEECCLTIHSILFVIAHYQHQFYVLEPCVLGLLNAQIMWLNNYQWDSSSFWNWKLLMNDGFYVMLAAGLNYWKLFLFLM